MHPVVRSLVGRKPPLNGAVVVITGASSGIGRATALAVAKRRADVVLVARRDQPLAEVAAQCRRLGVRALTFHADTSEPAAMDHVAAEAVGQLGRLDAWINNAGVYLVGDVEDVPPEVFQRVLEVNVLGYVNGVRAALPHFRRQRRGAFVNVASLFAHFGGPHVSAYSASKFAVRGFSESLREELRGTGIHVSTVYPASVDTPLWDHTANYSGHAVRPVEPIYSTARVARAIVSCVERPRREVVVGLVARAMIATRLLAPWLFERAIRRIVDWRQLRPQVAPPTTGNLFTPVARGTGTKSERLASRRRRVRRGLILASLAAPMLASRALRGPA